MVINTEYDFGSATRDELYQHAKEIARKEGISKGISKLSKRELADFILDHKEPTTQPVTEPTTQPVIKPEVTTNPETIQTPTITTTTPIMTTTFTERPTPEAFAKQLVPHWRTCKASSSESDRKRMWQECFDMCDNLQALLLKTYAESTVWKSFTQQYRKAIALEANLLDPTVKGGYIYTAYPMAFWKVDQGSRTEIDNQTKIAVNSKKQNAIRVPEQCRETLLSLANDFVLLPSASNQDIWKKALAISLLTGRRFYVEVCRNAQFHRLDKVVDFNRTLGFTGQAKGGTEKAEQVYELPTYVENIDLLIKNTATVQNFVRSKDWYTDNLTSKEFQSKIKSQCELALRPFNEITMPYSFLLTIKDLRALYMAFCYYDYKVLSGRYPDMDSYIGSIAGHDVTTDNGTYYRVGTTEHYKGFIDARWDN